MASISRSASLRFSGESDTASRLGLMRSHSAGECVPSVAPKPQSIGSTRELKSAMTRTPGQERVTDSGTPIKPVRVPEDGHEKPDRARHGSKVTFDAIEHDPDTRFTEATDGEISTKCFSVLVAEDDPINSKIMKKRLEKLGHRAYMTVNGEECSSAHGERASEFDAILMDLQMPIVDGYSSTKMIRSYEKTRSGSCLSPRAKISGRIPIFAVSASLEERDREKYTATGFDGWILKPVDFKRVDQLLKGIVEEEVRNECLYEPGKWEQGGWFHKRQDQDAYDVDTRPSNEAPTTEGDRLKPAEPESESNANSEGTITPTPIPQVVKADTI